jgi:hypothetical protein
MGRPPNTRTPEKKVGVTGIGIRGSNEVETNRERGRTALALSCLCFLENDGSARKLTSAVQVCNDEVDYFPS